MENCHIEEPDYPLTYGEYLEMLDEEEDYREMLRMEQEREAALQQGSQEPVDESDVPF